MMQFESKMKRRDIPQKLNRGDADTQRTDFVPKCTQLNTDKRGFECCSPFVFNRVHSWMAFFSFFSAVLRPGGKILSRELMCALFFSCLLQGCTGEEIIDHHQPATTRTSGDIRLSDAKPLDDLESDEDIQITLTDKLSWPQTSRPVYFGESDQFDSDDPDTAVAASPLIAIRDGQDWKGVPLVGPGLEDAGWKYVGAGPATGEVWGLLDTSAGDSRSNFAVAHSDDGGNSFTLKVIHKPCRHAEVYDFAMSSTGKGRITLSLDADCETYRAGLYHYDTVDHGKTWSKSPRFEPDAMVRADPVSDNEQPAPVEKPVLVLYLHRPLPVVHRPLVGQKKRTNDHGQRTKP